MSIEAPILGRCWKLQDLFQLSFWDALIVAAAKSSDWRYLLTEALEPDQDLNGIRMMSPFLTGPELLSRE